MTRMNSYYYEREEYMNPQGVSFTFARSEKSNHAKVNLK